MAHRLLRRAIAAGGIFVLASVAVPQVAIGAAPPERSITINITDKGFEKSDYTVAFSPGTSSNGHDSASVTFKNLGTIVHTATAVPSTLDEGSSFGERRDALGNPLPCQLGAGCSKTHATDTGGIDPGGSVTLGFAPPDSTGVPYTLTSATDCLGGQSNPSFNCAPITLNVVAIAGTSLGGTFPGSLIQPTDSSLCDPNLPAVIPTDGGPAFCYTDGRVPGKLSGSPSKPLGDTTVKITDFGFDPTIVYVKGGSTVTWVNTGARVHTIFKKGPPYPPDGYNLLDSGGLAPGASYSYHFVDKANCPIPSGCASTNYQSLTDLDLVPQTIAPQGMNGGGCGVTVRGVVKTHNCGQPALVGTIRVVG